MSSGADEPWDPIGPPGPQVQRPRRVPHFQRPAPPRDWRWVVGGIGKTLVVIGLLMFAFVGYQLWGTGIQTARAQNTLQSDFERLMASTTTSPATTTTAVTDDTVDAPVVTSSTVPVAPDGPPIPDGDVLAQLLIPKIDLDWFVVQGIGKSELQNGPGHFVETPMPGQLGNAAIAGHRTTHGAPFGDLDELAPGDLITVIMASGAGTFTYSVTSTIIVEPSEYVKVIPTVDPSIATLTLATCHPEYTSRQRLVVQALLVPELSDQVMAPPSNTAPTETSPDDTLPADDTLPPDDTLPADDVTTTAAAPTTVATTDTAAADDLAQVDDGFSGGWFDDTAAIVPTLVWGLALLAVAVGAYYVGKASNRLYVSFIVGCIPFLIVLYFFFENVNRLLPPGL